MTYRTPWLFTWKLIANLNCSIPIFWPSKSSSNFKQVIDQISHSYGIYSNGRALQPFLLTTMLPIKHNWVKLTWFYSVAKANLKDTIKVSPVQFFFFFSVWVFFHGHSRITGIQGKGEGISLTPHHHFHLLHWHLDISLAITAKTSPLDIARSRTRNENLWFPSASR